jgi:hypothetical protein
MKFRTNIHGVEVVVESDVAEFIDDLEFDFGAFAQLPQTPVQHVVSLKVARAPAQPPIGLKQTFRGTYGVCFDQGEVRHVLYPGPVWLRYDFQRDEGFLAGEDLASLYQRLYLTVLSRVGEWLDRRGLHRVHALGVDSPRGGCLFLLPSGMGKSTLAVPLLQREGWRLLSEDTPLIDRAGQLHPFPFRLGLRDHEAVSEFPVSDLRERSPKVMIRAEVFPLCTGSVAATHIFVGAWTTGQSSLEPISIHRVFSALFRDAVVGVGLPQVAELFLRRQMVDVANKAGLGFSRLVAALTLQRRCQCFRLFLGPDVKENVRLLTQWTASGPR